MMNKFCVVLMLFGLAVDAIADQVFYRYLDANEAVVIDDKVPSEFIHKGYEVVSSGGQVIEVILPYDPLLAERLKKQEEQQRKDALLLRSYSSVEDLWSNRDRKLLALEREKIGIESTIQDYTQLLEREKKNAARLQRSGRKVSEAIENTSTG